MIYFVYTLTHPETNKVVYVGSTFRPKDRIYSHRWRYKSKHGYEPIFEIVEAYKSFHQCRFREWELIKKFSQVSPLNQKTDKMYKGGCYNPNF